jgi:DNA-binding CsgD family transcriptional regulator
MLRDRLLAAVGQLYQCALSEEEWPGCLTSIRELLDGTSINLLYHDRRSRGGIQIALGADPELYRWYREFGHAIDPWALASRLGDYPSGCIVVGASLVDHARFKRTEFYAAAGRRYEVSRSLIGVLETSPYQTAALTVNRGDRAEEFEARDARTMAIVVPHIRRALAIQQKLAGAAGQRLHILDAMDRLGFGVVLVDFRGRPVFVNRYAARVLEARDGLAIESGSIVASAPAAASRLRRALGSAIAVTRGDALTLREGEFLIPRSAGRRPLHASVSPAARHGLGSGPAAGAAALLFLLDPERRPLPLDDRLRELFSLTAAEARVAGALAAGRRVADISDEFGVSRETVRSQVKQVLDKAGARSQSDFIRLVSTEAVRLVRAAATGSST